MADLTPRSRDRGQLLIITGLGIALFVVLLALALNTAVFGEVHVATTDGNVHEERTAVAYEDSVARGVDDLILPVNDETDPEYDARRRALEREIGNWSETTARLHGRDGVSTRVSLAEAHFETDVVHDNESRVFTNRSGHATWTVVGGMDDAERYEITVTDEAAVAPGDCFGKDDCFNVTVNGGAWVMSIYEKDSDIAVKVEGEGECTTASPARINLTAGTLDGASCFTPFFEDPDVAAPYAVRYANADNASGTYEITKIVGTEPADEHYYGPESGRSPRLAPRLVAANVTVRYRSSELYYENEIRVDPGDDDA